MLKMIAAAWRSMRRYRTHGAHIALLATAQCASRFYRRLSGVTDLLIKQMNSIGDFIGFANINVLFTQFNQMTDEYIHI